MLIVLLLIGGGAAGFFLLRANHGGTSQPQSSTSGKAEQMQANGQATLTVTAHPTVIIENDAGFIHVKAGGADNKITLQLGSSTNSSNGSGNASLPYTETSDSSTFIFALGPPYGSDLTVTVPATSDLKLYTNDKDITVDSISGQMDLVSNTGSVTVTHSTMTTDSILDDNTGAINATQDMLQGHVTLENNTGATTFSGSLDAAGIYTFQNNGGTLDVSLPLSASFHIDATANSGSVSSNYPSVQVKNGAIHADVGKAPRALVTLYNNAGTISLHGQGE